MNRIFDRQTTGRAGATPRLALLAAGLIAASGSAHAAGICMFESVAQTGLNGFVTYQSSSGAGLCGFPAGLSTSGSQGLFVNPGSMPLGLTSGSLGIVLDGITLATGSASLETGTVRNVTHSNSNPPTIAADKASFGDVVHFTITGGAASAPVAVLVHEDGFWNGTDNQDPTH